PIAKAKTDAVTFVKENPNAIKGEPGHRRASIGEGHEIVEISDRNLPSGIGCELHSSPPRVRVPCPPGMGGKGTITTKSPSLQYRDNLVKRYPKLEKAELTPIKRNLGEPGLWEESIYTGSGKESWSAKMRDGTKIQLDDIDASGFVVDTKMRGIYVGREIPPAHVPDVINQIRGAKTSRVFETFPESEQKKLLKQLRFSKENSLNGVRWETNSPEFKMAVERYAETILSKEEQKLFSIKLIQR
ncbi:MAG TPA: hypothetical protein VHO68_04965, partial [Bacteroidales bacterium]|nr:hypothetical protein [Bacteroidales bacterium]